MAISHICVTCGADLTRVRAPLDPHYGLPVVVCPACATAVVRRLHPLRRFHRSVLRLATTLAALGFQVAALGFFMVSVVTVCLHLGNELPRNLSRVDEAGEVLGLLFLFGVLPIAAGAWLTAGLAHWRRAVAWLVFTAIAATILAVDTVIGPVIADTLHARGWIDEGPALRLGAWLSRLRLLSFIMIVAAAGIPVGRFLRWRAGDLRRIARRWRRRRLRIRSQTR